MRSVFTSAKYWLRTISQRNKPKAQLPTLPYTALSPINTVSNLHYMDALNWALNEGTIQNIALTGPYGSGKSSVIRTFEDSYRQHGFRFLDISLATFKEKEPADPTSGTAGSDNSSQEVLNQIEASILQQIFYREKDQTIPDSRFKKIVVHTPKSIFITAILLTVWASSILALFYPAIFHTLFDFLLIGKWRNYLFFKTVLPRLIFISGTFYFLFRSMRNVFRLKLSKIKVFDNEVEMDSATSKSILNQHIDEIIYFFKQTDFNVVIIEDLDRFNQPEIFTKLREINTILNKSEEIHRKIVFVYAVRDDMFTDKARAKFFDFIIPIIPIINYSNSSEKLRAYGQSNRYQWDDALVDDVALFIDDMRLLQNIVNEFHVYYKTLSSSLASNKLLALLVYKNIFPNDFVKLSEGSGVLFKSINGKEVLIKQELSGINSKISLKEAEIKLLQQVFLKNIIELRSVYMARFLAKHPGLDSFVHKGSEISITDVINDKFSFLTDNSLTVRLFRYGTYQATDSVLRVQFADLETEVDSTSTYSERVKQIEQYIKNSTTTLKDEIAGLQLKKRALYARSIKELLEAAGDIELTSDTKQNQILSVLLRAGYIDETYIDYVSLFHEGSLSRTDYEFMLAVKVQKPPVSFTVPLTNLSKICAKLSSAYFSQVACLNVNLLKYLMATSDVNNDKLNRLLNQIAEQTEASQLFLQQILNEGVMPPVFFEKLLASWPRAWSYISRSDSQYTDAAVNYLFLSLLEYVPIDLLRSMHGKDSFRKAINETSELFGLIPDKEPVKKVITALDVKFEYINEVFFDEDLVRFIYEGNHYQLNDSMVKLLLKKFDKLDEVTFNTSNYSALYGSQLVYLIKYANDSIEDYVNGVFLALPDNKAESVDFYTDLLNKEDLSFSTKCKIILQTHTKITDLTTLLDKSLLPLLLKEYKVEYTWHNLYTAFDHAERQITPELITFISPPNSGFTLEILVKDVADKIDGFEGFVKALLQDNLIPYNSYSEICTKEPFAFSNLAISGLARSKVQLLIDSGIIPFDESTFITVYDFNKVIGIDFLQSNTKEIETEEVKLVLTPPQLAATLGKFQISYSTKQILINTCNQDLLQHDIAALTQLLNFLSSNQGMDIRDVILFTVFMEKSLSTSQRVMLFDNHAEVIDLQFARQFMVSLEKPYSSLLQDGRSNWPIDQVSDVLLKRFKSLLSSRRQTNKGIYRVDLL